MTALALQSKNDALRNGTATPPPLAVLAQRKSSLGGPGAITAPPIVDAGRPLDAGTRSTMESGFGQDFSKIRVHDDARAHDNARDMGARAYAAGDHIVFGEGHYRPETAMGQALIAHELAHSVQQGGVQMKADGPLPAASDAELEGQADRAAAAVTAGRPAPALSRIGTAAVFRNDVNAKTPSPETAVAAKLTKKTSEKDLPDWVTHYKDGEVTDSKPLELTVYSELFTMPVEKGGGDWVKKLYDSKSDFTSIIFPTQNFSVFKEGSATREYRDMWLEKFGFKTTTEVVDAIETAKASNPAVKEIADRDDVKTFLTGFKHPTQGLSKSKSAVDHIIEKHMGGVSTYENLQLFDSARNSASGSKSAAAIANLARELAKSGMRGENAQRIAIIFKKVEPQPPGDKDATYYIEHLLRYELKLKIENNGKEKPVKLVAGNNSGPTHIKDDGTSTIEDSASRVIVGVYLEQYKRETQSPDKITATLDNGALRKLKLTDKDAALVVTATKVAETPVAGPAAPPEAGVVATTETRRLAIAPGPINTSFFYPFMSPGKLNSAELKSDGLHGTGVIYPTIPLLPKSVDIAYGPNYLDLKTKLDKSKLQPPIPGFRFGDGELSIKLAPNFLPSGKLPFEIGPVGKPVILGEFNATYQGGAFIATGDLTLAATVPGISGATGQFKYHSHEGWSGKLKATSGSIPNSTVDVELGFHAAGAGMKPYATGAIITKIKDTTMKLNAGWTGSALSYRGEATVLKPLPLVESVLLKGGYANGQLYVEGEADIKWRGIDAKMKVYYTQKDGGEGRFGGSSVVDVKTEKAAGKISLNFNELGQYWGKGSISYQVTKDIRPTLGVELTKDQRVKVFGEVKIADIPLTKEWPKPGGGDIPIIKGVGVKFSIPTPVPAVTAYGEIRGGLSVGYGVGPVSIKGVTFNGELYPLEEDPKVKAQLKGKLSVPAYGEIRGTFGAYIGLEVLLGAAGAKGGIDVKPTLGVKGEGAIEFDAAYEAGAFSFAAEAYAKGSMYAKLGVDLKAELYAAWGALSHTWTYPVASVSKQLGPELKITLGKIAYGKDGKITWPNVSQIDVSPKEIDPKAMVMELLGEGKATKK
jgi:hypothetical protein